MKRRPLMRCYKEQDMSAGSPIRIPFLWENSPGVSKVPAPVKHQSKLPPPPICVARRVTPLRLVGDQEINVCTFPGAVALKSPFNNHSAAITGRGKPGDPFLAAYIKCTAASPLLIPRKAKPASRYKSIKASLGKYLVKLSCKYSATNVRDDNLLPKPQGRRNRK